MTPQMHGRYPDYDVLAQAEHWDEVTRELVLGRVQHVPPIRFFSPREAATLDELCNVLTAQDDEPRIAEIARQGDLLLIGPNCMGIYNRRLGVRHSADQPSGDPGNVAFIGQSGVPSGAKPMRTASASRVTRKPSAPKWTVSVTS